MSVAMQSAVLPVYARQDLTFVRGEGRTDDGESCLCGDAPAAHELDGNAEPLHLLGDLWPGAVNDAHVVARVGELQDRVGRLAGNRPAALEDDETHERYSALIRT